MKEQIIKIMIKDANYKNGILQSGVFSAFQIACIINQKNVFEYKVRKELNILKELGFVDLKKFSIDNESNLKCWKWFLTEKGYKYNLDEKR
jgi:hypothetical protein